MQGGRTQIQALARLAQILLPNHGEKVFQVLPIHFFNYENQSTNFNPLFCSFGSSPYDWAVEEPT